MTLQSRRAGLGVLAVVLLAFPWFGPDSFAYDLAIRIAINAVVVIGLNLLFGYAGQISLGHAAFFGFGAYASAILTTHFDWSPLAALVAGAAATGALAFVIARPILRLSGHHLAMATLSLGLIATIVFNNETRWTGGSDGMAVAPLAAFGFTLSGEPAWYVLVAVLLIIVTWGALNLVQSPAGRALQAIRGSEVAARIVGIDAARFKTRVFVLSAVVASLMGSLMAHYVGFLTPAAAGLGRSVEFVMMVVLGGTASVFGSIVGAGIVTLLPQLLHAFESWETLLLGVILTGAMIFMRAGIVPSLQAAFAGRVAGAARAKQSEAPEESGSACGARGSQA
ncbi:branched-chain amino acid ABC transporter permease [Variovorax sp. YR216]|uniref:branched-chain amino acid ABC transporter permease n=1 Tax=Variovorax sp. YR216 TaxID=1882828 RepID=UPI0008951996|nr:branched-chain amino acid ABC transporter permease [Variovorax sp. YR216]SEB25984.1 amino acid/amide ABC transporter membrane protein 2, HAAT family [Variovorax sp. YR216]